MVMADIVKMEDGTCYEQKGKMHYIVPCPSKKSHEPTEEPQGAHAVNPEEGNQCVFRMGEYQIRYVKPERDPESGVSCIDAQQYIGRINLGYDTSLKVNKKNIGKLIVKRALSTCNVVIYYGDFITVGLMSGDRLMCDNLMVDLPRIVNGGKRRQ